MHSSSSTGRLFKWLIQVVARQLHKNLNLSFKLELRFFDRSGFGQLNLIFKVGFQVDQGAPNRTVSGNENQGWRRVREGRM